MADGELTLKLDDDTVRRLKAAAEAAGRPVADYAAELLSGALADRWSLSLRRLEEYDRTGEYVPLEEALTEFRVAVEERLAKRR